MQKGKFPVREQGESATGKVNGNKKLIPSCRAGMNGKLKPFIRY